MFCLNQSAFDILKAEIQRRCAKHPAGQVQQDIAIKRLEKWRQRSGEPLTLVQLRETLNDLFPDFDEQVLKRAAKANRPASPVWGRLKFATIAIVSLTGGIWFLNLPYPMIRYPVANTIPFVLLPSFMSMDHNYRQAIAITEQADQLVNQATSPADFDLGTTKVKQAQSHLNALPVWFLGYYPSTYCGLFACGWRFTLDEFQHARKEVARMEARLFQERNALTQVNDAEQAIAVAKQKYQQSDIATKQAALAEWQTAMDTLETVSTNTLAGRTAQTKLVAFERDFQEMAGFTANNERTGKIILAAQLAAATAQKFSSKSAQTVIEWQEAEKLWEAAIAPLKEVGREDPDYGKVQELFQSYQIKLSQTQIRLEQERASVQAYQEAQQMTQALIASVPEHEKFLSRVHYSQIQRIVDKLNKVFPQTTVYQDAQVLLKSAQKRLPKL